MKRIDVKRAAPRNENDFSQQAQVIEHDPEIEDNFDMTKFALIRMMEINEKYRKAISNLTILQGRIASLNNETQNVLEFVKLNIDIDEDEDE